MTTEKIIMMKNQCNGVKYWLNQVSGDLGLTLSYNWSCVYRTSPFYQFILYKYWVKFLQTLSLHVEFKTK